MDEKLSIDTGSSPVLSAGKELYQSPQLMEWGTLREITETVGYSGSNDGGRFPFGYKTR